LPKPSRLNRNAVNTIHLLFSKFRKTSSCLGVLAEGVAGFTADALYRGVTDKLRSFITATVMPLGQFVKYTRDRKISFGIISSFINCHCEPPTLRRGNLLAIGGIHEISFFRQTGDCFGVNRLAMTLLYSRTI
jgi:hypothetical protein